MHPSRRNERGIVLLAVIVCLIVIGTLCGSLLRMGLSQQNAARADERQVQADWLAESALERAAARLGRDSNYAGEDWLISPQALGGAMAGRVAITVQSVDGQPGLRLVKVQAEFPRDAASRARSTKQAAVSISTQTSGEGR